MVLSIWTLAWRDHTGYHGGGGGRGVEESGENFTDSLDTVERDTSDMVVEGGGGSGIDKERGRLT